MKRLIILLQILVTAYCQGQDTLIFLNGTKKTNIEFLRIYSNHIYYQKWKKNKPIQKMVSKDEVLAIYTPEGKFIITYLHDSLGKILDDKSMMEYIYGMEIAWQKYHNFFVPAVSFTLSAGAGIWPGIPWGLIVPVVIPAFVNLFKLKSQHLSYLSEDQKESYYLLEGSLNVAKIKVIRGSVFGGLSGYTVGMLINIYLINPR